MIRATPSSLLKNYWPIQAAQKAPDARPQGLRRPERTQKVREDLRGSENEADGLFQQPARILVVVLWILATGCEIAPQRHMEAAERRMNQGDYLGAAGEYERIVEESPKSNVAGDAYYWLGMLYDLYLDDPRRSLEAFQSVVERYPGNPYFPSALYRMAELYERRFQDMRRAIATYQRLVNASQDLGIQEKARFRIAEVYFELGEVGQARTEWEAFVRSYPESKRVDEALYRVAGTYFIQDRFVEALEHYSNLVRSHPASLFLMEAKFKIANCLEETHRYNEALQTYEAILESYPNRRVVELRIKGVRKRLDHAVPTSFLDKTKGLG